MVDLPGGAWTAALIGDYWPGRDALAVLDAVAQARHRSAAELHGYADHLRSITNTHLAGQDGAAAEAARGLFTRGEYRTRAAADRNAAKHRSYESARNRVAALREELSRIAEDGNAAIARIQESSAPRATKISAIVEVVTGAQSAARSTTAGHAGNMLAEIQAVLDAQGADLSARAFAASHGVDPSPPHPRGADMLTDHITARLGAPESGGCAPGPNAAGGEAPVPVAPVSGDSPSSPDRPSDAGRPVGPAGGLPAGVLAMAAGSAIGTSLADAAHGSHPADTAPADGLTAPAGGLMPPLPQAAPMPAAGVGPGIGVGPAAPAGAAGPGARPGTSSPGASLGRISSSAALVPGPAGSLGQSGVGNAGGHPSAAPHLHGAATSGPALLIRRMAAAPTRPPERAFATAEAEPRALTAVLAAMARQQPQLGWAVGIRPDGAVVVVTDLAGGWLPPGIDVPDGVRLLEPADRRGGLTELIGDCTSAAVYRPGEPLPTGAPLPMSARTRTVAPVDDLGWRVCQATRWRDGLPRLAHTLARAAVAGTGWLDSEVAQLHERIELHSARALAGYPDCVDGDDIGHWQLLASIEAMLDAGDHGAEDSSAAYHFAWFLASARNVRT